MATNSEKFLYMLAGTGIGAIMGILFAPRSGQETRSTITSQAQKGLDLVSEKVVEGKRYVQEKGGGTVRNLVEKGKNLADAGRQHLNESIEAGRQEYYNAREREVM